MKIIVKMLMAVAMVAALQGCRSGASSVGGNAATTGQLTDFERFDVVSRSYATWTDISMPVKLRLTSPMKFSLSGKAEMRRGEWIYISARMLGFEVATLWIDNDSVHAVDKYHKILVSESIASIVKSNGVSVADLQDLLLGRGFVLGENGGTFRPSFAADFNYYPSEEGLILLPKKQAGKLEYGFLISGATPMVTATSLTVGGTEAATVAYSQFTATPDCGSFAANADIAVQTSKPLNAELQWSFQSAKFNQGLKRQWSSPTGYRQVSASALLEMLSAM